MMNTINKNVLAAPCAVAMMALMIAVDGRRQQLLRASGASSSDEISRFPFRRISISDLLSKEVKEGIPISRIVEKIWEERRDGEAWIDLGNAFSTIIPNDIFSKAMRGDTGMRNLWLKVLDSPTHWRALLLWDPNMEEVFWNAVGEWWPTVESSDFDHAQAQALDSIFVKSLRAQSGHGEGTDWTADCWADFQPTLVCSTVLANWNFMRDAIRKDPRRLRFLEGSRAAQERCQASLVTEDIFDDLVEDGLLCKDTYLHVIPDLIENAFFLREPWAVQRCLWRAVENGNLGFINKVWDKIHDLVFVQRVGTDAKFRSAPNT